MPSRKLTRRRGGNPMRRINSRRAILVFVAAVIGAPSAGAQPKPKEGDDEMEFEPDEVQKKDRPKPPPDTTPPTKTLERATKLYDKKDYYSASIEFAKVINKESG